ncbi:DUF599 domain-containing protein [Paraburkholderia sp. EG285A]|uniref:DUF599 domain-containing protein n=1 Tax=Paraburkholderia sp. EG285A TaxID=3237009 RepID=UPI0034D3061D
MDLFVASNLIAVGLSIGLLIAYYWFLRVRVRKDPTYTIQAVLEAGRSAWVERVMDQKEGILAVQTLRNSIMGATFFASTAVVLIVGTLTLTAQGDKLADAWHVLSPFDSVDHRLWLIKLLVLLIDLLCAFVCFAQAIRLFTHVSVLLSVPPSVVAPSAVARLLVAAGRYHTLGMRCYYYAGLMLFWLFGSIFLVGATFALIAALYRLDKSSSE